MLPEIRIASPCSADWEKMSGNDWQRFCTQCNKSVYNFSAMTAPQVEKLVAKTAGSLCARFYQRADGTMLTQDCPVGFRAKVRRLSRVAGAALSAAMGLSFAAAQNVPQSPSLVQIESAKDDIEIEVVDTTEAVIPNADVRLSGVNENNKLDTLTDSKGRAHFASLPKGRYEVLATARGFRATRMIVDLPAQNGIGVKLQLELSVAVMGEIITVDALPTIPSVIEDQLPLSVEQPKSSLQRRNPRSGSLAAIRFFSGAWRKLGV